MGDGPVVSPARRPPDAVDGGAPRFGAGLPRAKAAEGRARGPADAAEGY